MPATPLTLLVAHLTLLVAHLTLLVAHYVREQVKVQVQRSGKMKTWGGSRTQRANILNSQIVFCQNSTCPFDHLSIQGSFRRCFVTERKRQWEVREALKAINHKLALVNSDNPAAAGRFMELYMSCQERNGQLYKL